MRNVVLVIQQEKSFCASQKQCSKQRYIGFKWKEEIYEAERTECDKVKPAHKEPATEHYRRKRVHTVMAMCWKATNKGATNVIVQPKRSSYRATDNRNEFPAIQSTPYFPKEKYNSRGAHEVRSPDLARNGSESKSIKSNFTTDGSIDQNAFNMNESNDVVSFTFPSPLRSMPESLGHSDNLHPKRLSISLTHMIDSDALSVLLEQKLQELTSRLNLPQCTLASDEPYTGLRSSSQDKAFSMVNTTFRMVSIHYNVCIFAYGQAESGKTYTVAGPDNLDDDTIGVNYRALQDLFFLSDQRKDTINYVISVQMLEIYNEQVRDLLAQERGINFPLLTHIDLSCNCWYVYNCSCLTVHVSGKNLVSGGIIRGSMHLVDLAGSERADKTEATGVRIKEAQHINKSLSALGDVIASLARKNAHFPYWNTKLTQLLQDALGMIFQRNRMHCRLPYNNVARKILCDLKYFYKRFFHSDS
ncbi:kinesin-like protein Klp68D [Trifolium pratense]|uniref:kinesin-like protein Klp68D n=1 Tax=Trifolium pratense TaxID=57577 RepID=UPI001E6941AB|nr:kinesin-like protein Klp68D [Trifolium pratense]